MTDRSRVFASVIACFLPGAAGLFKAANLKSDIFHKWRDRADVMVAGLTQGAIHLLLRVQERTIDLLGTGASLQPSTFTADPAPLVADVNRFQMVMRARDRLDRRMRALLRLGPCFLALACTYIVGWAMASVYFLGLNDGLWLRNAGIAVAGYALALVAAAAGLYAYLVGRLATTELLVDKIEKERKAALNTRRPGAAELGQGD